MEIPAGWTYLTTEGYREDSPVLTHETTALYFGDGWTLQVTHNSRDTTTFQVREGRVSGFDFQNRETIRDYGFHRSPSDAFRFAEAWIADGGDDWRSERRYGGVVSPRYSRAVTTAYARA